MTAHDELDGELRRLFGDARLDLMPREGAEEAVVAGARRIKRRRTALAATGGALAVTALVANGLVLGGLRTGSGQSASPPAEPVLTGSPTSSTVPQVPAPSAGTISTENGAADAPSPTSTVPGSSRKPSSTVPSPPERVLTVPVLGPSGYGKLRLGMSYQEASATGQLADPSTAPTTKCETYTLVEGVDAISGVVISQTDGIVSFQGEAVRTPEGIEVGSSTLAQLTRSYPGLVKGNANWWTVSAGSGATYSFFVTDDGTVTKILLDTPAYDNCGS